MPTFLGAKVFDVSYGETMCVRESLFRHVLVLLDVSLMLVNQQYVLNQLSLNRNTHKPGFVLIS